MWRILVLLLVSCSNPVDPLQVEEVNVRYNRDIELAFKSGYTNALIRVIQNSECLSSRTDCHYVKTTYQESDYRNFLKEADVKYLIIY